MGTVREVEFRKRKIEAIISRAKQSYSINKSEECKADYARYLCVLISGCFEKSIAEIFAQYAKGKAPNQIKSYLDSSLKKLTNVDSERLLVVMGRFDQLWKERLEKYIEGERESALNSIVGLRNDISHGGNNSVSFEQIEKYWLKIKEIIDELEDVVYNRSSSIAGRSKK